MVFDRDELYATERGDAGTSVRGMTAHAPAKGAAARTGLTLNVRWSLELPIQVTTALVAGDTYFCAGAVKKTGEGMLVAVAGAEGRKLGQWPLTGIPVQDGLAAARGRLYLSTEGGRVLGVGRK